MKETPKRDLSIQEQELLHYATLVGEALKRVLPEVRSEPKTKPRWQIFLESTGGAALITVMVGGLIAGAVGQWITNEYQKGMKERETRAATYKEYLGQGKETVTRSYEVLGRVISASDDLIEISGSRWDPSQHADDASKQVITTRIGEVVTKYNAAANQWRDEREKLGLFITYFHDANEEVVRSWRRMQDSVTGYMTCAEALFSATATRRSDENSKRCQQEKEELYASQQVFTEARIIAAEDLLDPR